MCKVVWSVVVLTLRLDGVYREAVVHLYILEQLFPALFAYKSHIPIGFHFFVILYVQLAWAYIFIMDFIWSNIVAPPLILNKDFLLLEMYMVWRIVRFLA